MGHAQVQKVARLFASAELIWLGGFYFLKCFSIHIFPGDKTICMPTVNYGSGGTNSGKLLITCEKKIDQRRQTKLLHPLAVASYSVAMDISLLKHVPSTRLVTPSERENHWEKDVPAL